MIRSIKENNYWLVMKFMNLPKEFRDKKKSKNLILPISFKTKTTRENNSCNGPKEIIKASKEIEYYDSDLDFEAYEKGVYQEDLLEIKEKDFNEISHKILDRIIKLYDPNKFLITLGSDHSTTIPIIEGISKHEKDFGIIVFDAHSDLREPWGKETWWHACTSRLISKDHKSLLVGVRSMDFYEKEYLDNNKNIDLILAKDLLSSKNSFDLLECDEFSKKLKKLPKKIYVSIDVDVFDSSIIRSTGTPEPNGLNWMQINNLLEKTFKEKEVIAVDLTEFSPKAKDSFLESYFLAKLVYRLIGYKNK